MPSRPSYFVHTLLRARDWQNRPQFDQVAQWWRDGGQGVCALIGMGGAGKTAIADRFLNELLDETSTTRQRVSPTESVFVYSFYDDDKPENFFRHLQIWLEGTSAPDKQKSPTQLMFDIQQRQGLIILDGLEKVQESGARGGFGRLTSPSLRDLLNHIASGSARELSVLVTSRFPLTDLRDSQPRFFHTITVDQIDVAAGVALLRTRGVRGSDLQLAPIVEHCGRHALTIDLAGGYIKEYGHGDPSTALNLGTAEELQAKAEQELDDEKRAVLKQGIRFARIAQRYRDAMQGSDEAALALLERICLFRLGVDSETLAAIFTGKAAKKVSGKALSKLNTKQLQKKLDWLVRMRIIESSQVYSLNTESATPTTLYKIHPAVRGDFLSGIGREDRKAGHAAVRKGLETTLPEDLQRWSESSLSRLYGLPDAEYPSDTSMLDLLEEIIFHTLNSIGVHNAWPIYEECIGGYRNLFHRLGDYERGVRICTPMAAAAAEWTNESANGCYYINDPKCANDLGLYLMSLGQLKSAASCFERQAALRALNEDWGNVSTGNANLANTKLLAGRLPAALNCAEEAIRLAELSRSKQAKQNAYAFRGHSSGQLGLLSAAYDDFRESHSWQRVAEPGIDAFYSLRAIQFAHMLVQLGRGRDALRITDNNREVIIQNVGYVQRDIPRCNLVLASLACMQGDLVAARESLSEAHHWAMARNAREVLCWSALVRARTELLGISDEHLVQANLSTEDFGTADGAIAEGLKIARDCGYGLYHIDLLLERARLHLLRGDAGGALNDIEVALENGIPANEETGQVELLAANHKECGYAWAIPAGLQLRAEAQLLHAAQIIGAPTYKPRSRKTSAAARELIKKAKSNLRKSMTRWKKLRDPEPTEDNNFVHPETGEEYNYKAEETHRILDELHAGTLTRDPLNTSPIETQPKETPVADRPAKVFFSYAHKDEKYKDELIKHLSILKRQSVIDVWHDRMIVDGDEWAGEIDDNLEDADVILLLVSADFLASDYCYDVEMKRALERHEAREARVIPIILRTVDWNGAPFGKLQARPKDAKPVDKWDNQDEAFTDIAKGIRNAIENP